MTRTAPAVALSVAALAAVLPASPSSAEVLQVFARAAVWVDAWTPTGATVCASGLVDHGVPVVGVWTFTVAGAGTAGPVAVAPRTPTIGSVYPTTCTPVTIGIGGIDATLAFGGVVVGAGDVAALCGLVGIKNGIGTEVGYCTDTT